MPLKKKITEKVRIGDLVEYEKNNKNHTDESIAITKESIHKFGYTTSIEVDEANIILAGHGRKKALLSSGHSEDDLVEVTRLIGYTPAEKAEYRIFSNISADQATYNIENVELEVREFQLETVADYFDIDLDAVETNEEEEDEVPSMEGVEIIVKQGDIFQLGEHRLMCGDSTSAGDMKSLMGNVKIDMVFTDPPYGVSYTARTGIRSGKIRENMQMILNDDLDKKSIFDLVVDSLNLVMPYTKEGSPLYVCNNWHCYESFTLAFQHLKLKIDAFIVRNKDWMSVGHGHYRSNHEFIFYTSRGGNFYAPKGTEHDVRTVRKLSPTNKIHTTEKPVALVDRAIVNSSKKGDVVCDLFCGSGVTLISSEKNSRLFVGMELDPKYVQVILKRYHDYIGGQKPITCLNRKLDLSPILTAPNGNTKEEGS